MSEFCRLNPETHQIMDSPPGKPSASTRARGECTAMAGRNVVITGGTRGLGRHQAKHALRCGARHVTITGRRREDGGTPEDGFDTQSALRKEFGYHRVNYKQSDVRSDEDTFALFDKSAREKAGLPGTVHAVSLNAGIFGKADQDRKIDRLTSNDFEKVMDINCTGVFRGMREFARAATETQPENPSMLLIKSIYGSGGSVFSNAGYQASKFCVDGLVKQGAVELARADADTGRPAIRVNSLSPGFVKSSMTQGWWQDPRVDQLMADAHPAGDWVDIDSVGETATFLLNAPASVTGVDIFVDQGAMAEAIPNWSTGDVVRSINSEPCCGKGN